METKEQIERIALEVAEEMDAYCCMEDQWGRDRYFYEFAPSELPEFVTRILARVDATRAKEAVAEVASGVYGNRLMWATEDAQNRAVPGQSLFLSPSIPEGMVLVPIEPTDAMLKAARIFFQNGGWSTQRVYAAMLAAALAAKGEPP